MLIFALNDARRPCAESHSFGTSFGIVDNTAPLIVGRVDPRKSLNNRCRWRDNIAGDETRDLRDTGPWDGGIIIKHDNIVIIAITGYGLKKKNSCSWPRRSRRRRCGRTIIAVYRLRIHVRLVNLVFLKNDSPAVNDSVRRIESGKPLLRFFFFFLSLSLYSRNTPLRRQTTIRARKKRKTEEKYMMLLHLSPLRLYGKNDDIPVKTRVPD